MPNKGLFFLLIVAGGLFILANLIFFTVREDQQALVLQFGAPVGEALNEPGTEEAGLKFKTPIQNVIYFDRRNLEFDLPRPLEIIVANEERLLVDAFVRYQIQNPLLYFQSLGGAGGTPSLMRAQFDNRITSILSEAMREQLGSKTISRIINQERAQIMAAITSDVTNEANKLGVDIIDVRIRQADFPTENAENVNQRMESDYKQQAESIRANGERRAREITAAAEKEVVRIRAEAEEKSQIIRGRADAVRNCIFANAYEGVPAVIRNVAPLDDAEEEVEASVDRPLMTEEEIAATLGISCRLNGRANPGDSQRREFFSFYRSLNAYEQALRDGETTIILSPDSEFFRYFNGQGSGVN
ncbi:MAG: protease modulator HflC [Pseudomonadota bacterium]